MINYPALLLRKKSELYPEGRTSYRFKRMLRNKVQIVGQTAFKDQPPKMSELDQQETEEPEPNQEEEQEQQVEDTADAYGAAIDSALL